MFAIDQIKDYILDNRKEVTEGFVVKEFESPMPKGWPDRFPRSFVLRPSFGEDGNNFSFPDDEFMSGQTEEDFELLLFGPWCKDKMITAVRSWLEGYSISSGNIINLQNGSTVSHIIAKNVLGDDVSKELGLVRVNFSIIFDQDDCNDCLD